MTNFKPKRRLSLASAGGLAGFLVLIVAGITYIILAWRMGGFGFGLGLLLPSESFIISVIVSVLISLGAGIPACALGANRRRGLLAGLVAMAVFNYISGKGHDIDYAPFGEYDMLAYISAILVSTVVATIGKNTIRLGGVAILIALTGEILRLRSVLPSFYLDNEQLIGFVVSLLTWIIFPLIAAFFVTLEQNEPIIMESAKILISKVADQFQISKLLFAIAGGILVLVIIFSIVEYQETQKLSTPQLIDRAYHAGRISEEERLLYFAYAIYEYESLPKRFRGHTPWEGTFILRDLYEAANSPSVLCSMSLYVRSEFQRLLKPDTVCE